MTAQRAIPRQWSRNRLFRALLGVCAACGLVAFPPIGSDRSVSLLAPSGSAADEVPWVVLASGCDDSDDDGRAADDGVATAPSAPHLERLQLRLAETARGTDTPHRRPHVSWRGRAPPRSNPF